MIPEATATQPRPMSAPAAGRDPAVLHAIEIYRSSLDALRSDDSVDTANRVLGVLRARDAVALVLARESSIREPLSSLLDLNALDRHLQDLAAWIDRSVGRRVLESWRETRQAPAAAWWWSLDERAAANGPKPSVLWAISIGFCIAVTLSLATEISRRFLSVGPDWVGTLSIFTQALLAILAGSTLTQAGRGVVDKALVRIGVGAGGQPAAKLGLALLVLIMVVGLRLSLPLIAQYYNEVAEGFRRNHDITSEIENYQRAISLNPDYVQAHYNLGSAYEDALDYDKALAEYQRAHIGNPDADAVTNNLARLLILRRSEFASALELLDPALTRTYDANDSQQLAIRYTLLKNRAWAHLGLKQFSSAERDLKSAFQLRPNGAAAHCLMGQLLDSQGKLSNALNEWEACLRYQHADNPPQVEESWLATAQERLMTGGAQ